MNYDTLYKWYKTKLVQYVTIISAISVCTDILDNLHVSVLTSSISFGLYTRIA